MGESAGEIARMCRAAAADERLSDGALYRKAAEIIDALVMCVDAYGNLADAYRTKIGPYLVDAQKPPAAPREDSGQ